MQIPNATERCSPFEIRAIRDALDVLSGNWKFPIMAALADGPLRFRELAKAVDGISDKMLSKELRDLELNRLVKRTVYDTFPPTVTYSFTEHALTLEDLLLALTKWGKLHRRLIIGKE